ncbi:MAG: hypothetical protein PHS88_11880, partial [Candidatus Omnitrophica bacterium]|nr:hypothetical protein [Candidatus Omnitrophota bacterium]
MASPLDNPANILIDEIEKPIDYKYYYHLFKKNVSIVITFVIIAITVSSIYAAKLPDEYRAMTQLIIEKPRAAWETVGAAESAKVDQAATSWDEDYYNTQQQIVLGSTVLRWVIKQLNLRQYFEIQNEDAIMARLRGMLQVSRVAKSRIFNIVASADDPQFVANLANAVADSYIRKNFEDSLYYNREILGWLSQGGEGTSKVITIQDPLGKIRRMKYEDLIET